MDDLKRKSIRLAFSEFRQMATSSKLAVRALSTDSRAEGRAAKILRLSRLGFSRSCGRTSARFYLNLKGMALFFSNGAEG